MKADRYNLFNFIHKALRAQLYDTALTLQKTDFTIETETETAIVKVQQTLKSFESHAEKENHFILPAISKFYEQKAMMIEGEHDTDEALSEQMKNKMEALRFAPVELKDRTGRQLFYLFIEFTGFNLIHMNKEEHILNEILWENYSDEELMAITGEIMKNIPPSEMMEIFPWMMKGITNLELIGFLADLEKGLPTETFDAVMNMAHRNIPERLNFKSASEAL